MIKKSDLLLGMLLLLMPCEYALAVDLDALEATVSAQAGKGEDCDDRLAQRIGQDLPADADNCHAKEQYRLLKKGLYRTINGDTKSLKHKFKSVATPTKIYVPGIDREQVTEKNSPYVIDLQDNLKKTPTASVHLSEVKQPHVKIEHHVSEVTHVEPDQHQSSVEKKTIAAPKLGCEKLSTFGHRGGPSAPENSIPAVLSGLNDMHNGVEIDTQRLSDGVWVVHHDPMIGRSSYGANGFVNLFSSNDWKQIYLLNRKGNQTNVKAPLLHDLLQAFRQHAVKGQVINIEIKMVRKGQYNCDQLADLHRQVRAILNPSQFLFTSTFLDALQCMRNVNHSVYLGLIIEPNPQSLKRVIDTQYGAEFRTFKTKVPAFLQAALKKKHKSNREWLSHSNYVDLAEMIGPNFGLHVDYRDIDDIANKMKGSGGRWMVYELNDDQGMLNMLKTRDEHHQRMPPAIIIDSPRRKFCHAF